MRQWLADATAPEVQDGRIALRLRPFELVTLRLRRG
jgi:alpha-mannosidase